MSDEPAYKSGDVVFFAFVGLERGRIVAYLGEGRYVIKWGCVELLVGKGAIYGLVPPGVGFWAWLKKVFA